MEPRQYPSPLWAKLWWKSALSLVLELALLISSMTLEKSLPHMKPQFPHKQWGEWRESYYCSTYTTGCYEHLKELKGQCTFVQDWRNATCWNRHQLYPNRKVNPLTITIREEKTTCGNIYLNYFSHLACSVLFSLYKGSSSHPSSYKITFPLHFHQFHKLEAESRDK